MNQEKNIRIVLDKAEAIYLPYETLSGKIDWGPTLIEDEVILRLFWITRGKGTVDTETVYEEVYTPQRGQEERIQMKMPAQPYSYEGQIMSLLWTLELIDFRGSVLASIGLTVSPIGKALQGEVTSKPKLKLSTRKGLADYHRSV